MPTDPKVSDPKTGVPRQLLLIKLLPNLVSILALCAGLTAIRFAIGKPWTCQIFGGRYP